VIEWVWAKARETEPRSRRSAAWGWVWMRAMSSGGRADSMMRIVEIVLSQGTGCVTRY